MNPSGINHDGFGNGACSFGLWLQTSFGFGLWPLAADLPGWQWCLQLWPLAANPGHALQTLVELRPDGQAGPALGQDTEKATKWAAGPETRLCDQIASRNLHGNFTGFYKVFSGARGAGGGRLG